MLVSACLTVPPLITGGQAHTQSSLKPSKFFHVSVDQTPPRQTDIPNGNDSDEEVEPGVYSKLDEGVGDGTQYITASFVKSNNKIKDQLLTQVRYFLDLMNANIIDGIKFHSLPRNHFPY